MATTEEAQAAARKFNGQEIDGRTLKVEFGRVARGARSAWYQSLLDSTRPCATTCSRGRPSTRVTSWLRSPIACLIGSATCSRRTFSARDRHPLHPGAPRARAARHDGDLHAGRQSGAREGDQAAADYRPGFWATPICGQSGAAQVIDKKEKRQRRPVSRACAPSRFPLESREVGRHALQQEGEGL